MTAALIYSALAVLLLVGVVMFLRTRRDEAIETPEEDGAGAAGLWNAEGLSVAERIFDPCDFWWLRDQVGFPVLAESLRRSRQRLALDWLRAVRRSFNDLLKTPEPSEPGVKRGDSNENWGLLRQALRFHLVLGYAYFVVRFFGPYNSLVPSFRWMRPLASGDLARENLGPVHSGRLT